MDELLIEDKKYVSSKRAAKITGYAKDYIGQLCREGRVPARLVGRSWYVLEAAIRDHRFGAVEERGAKEVAQENFPMHSPSPLLQTWQPPRYEASPNTEFLPSLNRLEREEGATIPVQKKENSPEIAMTSDLNESWRAWFDTVVDESRTAKTRSLPTGNAVTMPHDQEEHGEPIEPETEEDDAVVSVPLHILSQTSRQQEPFLRERPSRGVQPQEPVVRQIRARRNGAVRLIQGMLVLMTVSALAVAIIGSGYFDSYLISISQVEIISGTTVYNK